ncbi:MAG TPA: hypothetical protein PLR86_02995, partial [Planctomycetota bacterium]|nr:hypothetical protein [Planctomycetota bacterium]
TVPAYTRMKMSSQEQRAIANLLLIKGAQLEFRTRNYIDIDGDGIYEFATLGELLGIHNFRDRSNRRLQPALLSTITLTTNSSIGTDSAYNYRLYLSTAQDADSINKAEREFTCYAYPKHAGRTGRHAFGIRYDDTESATASDIFIKKDVEADFVVDENSIETWDIVKGPSGS